LLVRRQALVVERRTGLGADDSGNPVGWDVGVAADIDRGNNRLWRRVRGKTRCQDKHTDNDRRKCES
jgi:hypothetical protein